MRLHRPRPAGRKVVAVQLAFDSLPNLESVRERLLTAMVEACRERPLLVVFPAYTGLLTLHILAGRAWRWGPSLGEAAMRFGAAAEETLLDWARQLARQHDTYLLPGTCLVPGDDGLVHAAYLFGPDGQLLGRQFQTHVPAADAALGLTAGSEIAVWDVEALRVGIAVGSDAWYPEVGRILALQGATVMLCPTAVPAPYTRWRQLAGVWQQVQGNQFFAVEASLAGTAGGVEFEGRSLIAGPVELTGDGTVAAIGAGRRSEGWVAAELDIGRLFRVRREYPLARLFNVDLYDRAFPNLYEARRAAADRPPAGVERP
ncbi:MAG TPA: nitrilase-related carbon-nitrogen hydrolase [Bacillota bacterium]